MLPLHLFRIPAFTGVQLGVVRDRRRRMFALFLYLTLYLQNILGLSPLEAGAALPAADGRLVLRRAARGRAAHRGCQPRCLLAAGSLLAGSA